MQEEPVQNGKPVPASASDHPWIEMPAENDSLDESIRFSLDEIRIA